MIGFVLGILSGIAICTSAFNGEPLVAWFAAIPVIFILGFIFPITAGGILRVFALASPIAAILGFVTGNPSIGLTAIGIGALALGGSVIIVRGSMGSMH